MPLQPPVFLYWQMLWAAMGYHTQVLEKIGPEYGIYCKHSRLEVGEDLGMRLQKKECWPCFRTR